MSDRAPSSRLRLGAIAALVPEGARVADIGTDHAQLLLHVLGDRHATIAIGIDNRIDPLREASRTLARTTTEITARAELRRGDGLAPLAIGEVDTIVIAGMGARRITAIVDAHRDRVLASTRLVLQPANDWQHLRRWLAHTTMRPIDEQIVWEHERPHLLLSATPGSFDWNEDDIAFGPHLRRTPCPAYLAWLAAEHARMLAIVATSDACEAHTWSARVTAEYHRARTGS